MKRFILYVLLTYIAPIILFIIVFIPFISKQYPISEKQLQAAYKDDIDRYGWVKHVDSVQGFILGSSSLKYGISATVLSDSNSHWINFSMDARDPVVFYLLLEKYYPLKKPKVILVGLDSWIYSKRYYSSRDKIMYLDLDAGETFQFLATRHDPAIYTSKFKQITARFLPKEDLSVKQFSDVIPDDYGSVKLTRKALNFDAKEDWFQTDKYHWSGIEFAYIEKIKEFCKQNNIELIFVVPPKRKDYIEYAENAARKEHDEWWGKIAQVAGGEKVVAGYGVLQAYNQDSIFEEAYHLNGNGQVIFSKYLRNKIPSPDTIRPGAFPYW